MYSLVLMSALTTAPDASQFNGFFRDLFSFRGGCYGSCNGRDTSAGYASCNGRPGIFHGRFIEAFRRGDGCCGGNEALRPAANCSGTAVYSCNGGGSCSGSYSCQGGTAFSCSGGTAFSCSGGFANPAPYMQNPGFSGNEFLPPTRTPGYDGVPFAPNTPTPPATIDEPRYRISNAPAMAAGGTSRGTVVVRLPADARLFANERQLTMVGAERTFVTPELPAGGIYSYTFKVEYDRQGETVAVAKKVTVKPGETSKVEFIDLILARADAKPAAPTPLPVPVTNPTPVAPSAGNPFKANAVTTANTVTPPAAKDVAVGDRAKITVKLPPGATLYIDERRNDQAGPVREFTTPPLPAGKEFAYTMKVEILRGGFPETVTEKVRVRGGDDLSRDFATAFTK